MVRKLRFHEKKLLKKVDFINWKDVGTNNLKEIALCRKYGMQREEYSKYMNMIVQVRKIVHKLAELDRQDPFRTRSSAQLVEKLYQMGIIRTKRLKQCEKIGIKSFARRRLPVYMIQSGMFNGPLHVASKYVQHGHVRVGPNIVRDPAFLVTRNHEDFISWTDKIRKKIDEYNDERDDYED